MEKRREDVDNRRNKISENKEIKKLKHRKTLRVKNKQR
jgi:hypothetical protein